MKVQVTMKTTVEIDEREQWRVTKEYLSKVFDVLPDTKINDKGKLCLYWEESMGTHIATQEKFIRQATKNDKLYFKFLGVLKGIVIPKWE